ncbi:Uncharacterized protein HZ326_31080 [Fusarium oxysporum f. sp. albedinis]|nr:Uncharacterized protein HZ326_31080 [Fusarium oxysporum f. sp. albedinis]
MEAVNNTILSITNIMHRLKEQGNTARDTPYHLLQANLPISHPQTPASHSETNKYTRKPHHKPSAYDVVYKGPPPQHQPTSSHAEQNSVVRSTYLIRRISLSIDFALNRVIIQ